MPNLISFFLLIAIPAVNGFAFSRLEWNFAFLITFCANCLEHFSWTEIFAITAAFIVCCHFHPLILAFYSFLKQLMTTTRVDISYWISPFCCKFSILKYTVFLNITQKRKYWLGFYNLEVLPKTN